MKINDLKERMIHKPRSQRLIEIDMLRGFAIFLMVLGHLLWGKQRLIQKKYKVY